MPKEYDQNFIPQKQFALIGQKVLDINDKNQILFLKRSENSGGSRTNLKPPSYNPHKGTFSVKTH